MRFKRYISVLMALILLFSVIYIPRHVYAGETIEHYKNLPENHPQHIPAYAPAQSNNGYPFNDKYWIDKNYRVIVYGEPKDVPGNGEPEFNDALQTWEYRYLGFDSMGNKFSNTRFPNDADSGTPLGDKDWTKNPWDAGFCTQDSFSRTFNEPLVESKVKNAIQTDINRLNNSYKFYPKNGSTFMNYGLIQSYPTLLATGSFRMWHRGPSGKIWYETFIIPKQDYKLETEYGIKTEILSSDFDIGVTETTVDVVVKVTFTLKDDEWYNDPTQVQKSIHYTRDDIKKWDLKVEYDGKEIHKQLAPNGSNTMSETFTIKLSRNDISDGEKVVFTGTGIATFHNDHFYLDSAPIPVQFIIPPIPTPSPGVTPAPLPPDFTINAPEKKNINESYTVTINPIIPHGESIKSLTLERSVNGGTYQAVALSGYSATQQYSSIGTINYRATITLNNNLTKTDTATTHIVDERPSTAKAKIEQPSTAYEGHWISVYNRNTFTFEGATYNAEQAAIQGIGASYFDILDNSQYPLSGSLYQTRNYNDDVSFEIKYTEPGKYKNTIWAMPRNASEVSDTRGIQILRCPAIIASIEGTKKSNRKMTLDFSRTVMHPDYPLVSTKTSVIIEDIVTGEKVTVTNASHPDSTNIKTNALTGNKMDFLIKTNVDKAYKATINVEDNRGNIDTQTIEFTVVQDKSPIAKISTKEQEIRNPNLAKKAEIFLQDDSYSEDGDYITRTWEVAIDTDNDGVFTDETHRAVTTLEGYQDLSGDGSQMKVRFLKTGVGKINVRVKVKEVFGQPTIDTYVTVADRKEAVGTKVVEVLNVAPVVDFKIFSNISTTINIVVGKLSDALQTSVQNYIATMQSNLLGSKITPTINFIPQTMDSSRIPWTGMNPQRNTYTSFDGPANLNLKWRLDLPGITHKDENITPAQTFVTASGNIIVTANRSTYDENLIKWRYVYYIYLISPQGSILKNISAETTSQGVSIGYPILFIMQNGNMLGEIPSSQYGKTDYVLYDANFNIIKQVPKSSLPGIFSTQNNIIYGYNRMGIAPDYYQYEHFVSRYDSNLNLISHKKVIVNGESTSGTSYSTAVVDPYGNFYFEFSRKLVKTDPNGNVLWVKNIGDYFEDIVYDSLTDHVYIIYEDTWYDPDRQYIRRYNAVTGDSAGYNYHDDRGTFRDITVGKDFVYINTSDYYDYVQVFNKSNLSYNTYFNTFLNPSEPKLTKDNAVLITGSAWAGCSFLRLGDGTIVRLGNLGGDGHYSTSSGSFGNNNVAYVVCADYFGDGDGQWSNDRVSGPLYLRAIGTGGTPQNLENTLSKINNNIPSSSSSRDFVVSITEAPFQDNTDANITITAGLINGKYDQFFMIGNASSKPDGQKILNKGVTGGLYDINANMGNPLSSIVNYIKNLLTPVDKKVYEYHYSKNEVVNYDIFYTDYELDPSKASQWRYVHTPKTDGTMANNGVWLSAPITQFTKNGTYLVQHRQMDNTGVAAYDKYSNTIELTIHIEDGSPPPPPPPPVSIPIAAIDTEGTSKENRKMTFKLNYSSNNIYPINAATIAWSVVPVSGLAAADIKTSTTTGQPTLDSLCQKPGRVRATCTFKDTNGNSGSEVIEVDVVADQSPTGILQVTPVSYRNSFGIATINVKATITSPDDYIDGVKYYLTYDTDNDGSFTDEVKTQLRQFDDLMEFNVDVNTGVGNYLIQMEAVEGFKESTIPGFLKYDIDYMSSVLDWKNPDIWNKSAGTAWDSYNQAWRSTAYYNQMYVKPEHAIKINPNQSYYLEVKALRANSTAGIFYWGGNRLNKDLQHLEGIGGTYDYCVAAAVTPNVGSWTTYSSFKQGSGASYSNWGTDGCKYFSPGGLINYSNPGGTHDTLVTGIKFCTSSAYKTVSAQGVCKVDNIAPTYDVKPEKGVYLVGEVIRFKSYDGSLLNGDYTKGFFDSENDGMVDFEVRYAQNRAIMPIQDLQSYYATGNVDYMSNVLNWKDPNIWSMSGNITWDSTKQAWKATGYAQMYLKPEYAAKINPNYSYYMEVSVFRENNFNQVFYWGGDRLNINKAHLEGYYGTYDYSAANGTLPAVGSWTTYSRTKTGTEASWAGWGTDGCKYYRVGGLVNYSGASSQVTYIKDIKLIMPNVRYDIANSLDRAGEYTIDINAFDDPKDGDICFDSYKKPSNTSSNKIIVHRRPIASLSFVSSHASAPAFDFGNYSYLEGTQLRITDTSSDPDGFSVASTISYKTDSGNYTVINSGDTINLFYGSIFTFKVDTADNWGVVDTAIYIVSVINDLDMVPQIIPSTAAAGDTITARLVTNQYATAARVVLFGSSYNLNLISSTSSEKVWEVPHTISSTRTDGPYTAEFYAVSEGQVELNKNINYVVSTPINLLPNMPSPIVTGDTVTISASTSKYVSNCEVTLYYNDSHAETLSLTPTLAGSNKIWSIQYYVPEHIPPKKDYLASFTATTYNVKSQTESVYFDVDTLKITNVTISGFWNHWRGQVDMFGKQMSVEPHRFLSLECVSVNVTTIGDPDYVVIRFSPALEAMTYTDPNGHIYDYADDFFGSYVDFPEDSTIPVTNNTAQWEYYLPLAPSTKNWNDNVLRPPYEMIVTAHKGDTVATYEIDDIELTGNIYDLTYIQPAN